jgi:hypothetical protein
MGVANLKAMNFKSATILPDICDIKPGAAITFGY